MLELPFGVPAQVAFISIELLDSGAGCVMVLLADDEQLLASVTVTW